MRRLSVLTSILLGGAALIGSVERGFADKRVALVIGNYSYRNVEQLLNPKNDALTIAKMFKEMGFDQVDLVTDVGNLEFKRAIRRFADASADADVAVVYYAGHAIEVGGVNYILPVDAKLASDRDVEDEAIDLDRIVDSDRAKKLRLVIVDACRDNPFLAAKQQQQAVRSAAPVLSARKSGLGLVNVAGSQTLVAYAAEAGTSAEDGVGNNAHSPFTAALLRHLPEPGEDIRFAFGRIRDDVLKATDKRQRPFVYGSLGGDHISLVPGQLALNDVKGDYDRADKVGTRRAFEIFLAQYPTGYHADLAREALGKLPPPAPPASDDTTAWEKIKDTTDQAALRNFIKRFPDSPLATNAGHRLQVLADGEVTRAWEKVDKNDAAAIYKFMKAFPASILAAGTGKARLNELDQQAKNREAKKQAEIAGAKKLEAEREAAQAWQKIKNTGDRSAVLGFINLHPDSPLLAEAQQRLVAIDQEERERKAKQEAEAAEAKKRQLERETTQEWEKVKLSTDPSALLAFLSRYPNAAVSDQARQRVADLDREARERLERRQKEAEAAQREWDGIKSTNDRATLKAFIERHPTSPLATREAKQRLGVLDREAKEREQQAAAAEAKKQQVEREAAQEWEKIKSSTDQTALSTFLNRYPDAAVSNQVRQRLADLDRQAKERLERQQKEAEAAQREWDGLKTTDDRAALKFFIERYPSSPPAADEAKQRLSVLERAAKEREQQAAAAEAKKQQTEREAALEWEKVKSSTDQTALLTFLHRHPDKAVSDQARQRLADLDRRARERLERQQKEAEAAQREWDDIKTADDRAALKSFIKRYPSSLAAGEAKQRLSVLDREAKERELQAAATEAKKQQTEREAAQEWEKIKSSTDQMALSTFLNRHPDTAVSDQARRRLADLDRQAKERLERQQKEAEAAQREWDGIKTTDDRAALKFFIERYPSSPPAAGEAKQRLGVLDRAAKEREQQAAAAEAKKQQTKREAALEWEKIKSSTDQTTLSTFLNRYPDAAVSDQARQRLADLDRQAKERLERQQKEAEAAQREWDGIKSTNDRAALKSFVERYPSSPPAAGEAKQRLSVLDRAAKEREQQAAAAEAKKQQVEREAAQEWEKVKSSTDQTALLTFLHRHPDTAVSDQARQRLADLDRRAKETWEKIRDSANPGIIRGFIKQYPASPVALIDANERLLAVEREAHKKQTEAAAAQAEWNAVNKNDAAAIGDIVARFPDAPFAGDAKNRISELQREEKAQAEKTAAARDWQELKNSRDAVAIRAFIRKYPMASLALNEARERLDALTRESEPRPSAGHSADAGHHQQIASKPAPKPAEPAHRREPSPGARNFSGIGF
jgi:outer membrane protein assembly factor BamD (BamD/ComL family)